VSPKTFWRAEEAPTLSLRAEFKTSARSAQLLLQPYDRLDAGDWAQWGAEKAGRPKPAPPVIVPFEIEGDGRVRDVEIHLSANPQYRGAMTQVRLRLPGGTGAATIHAVELKPASE